jgi:hypothetical protein
MLQKQSMTFNLLFAYADDLGMIMQDLWKGVVEVYRYCQVLLHATGLELNINKICIVPL